MSSLIIRAAESDEELRLGNALMSHAHHQDHAEARRWRETAGAAAPGYQRSHTRIALFGDELAAAMQLTSHTIRLGEARLKTAGFGWLSTAKRHRHKGVASALMHETFTYMREQNYHIAMLFGIPNFYKRFGFATNLQHTHYTINAREAAGIAPAQYRTRRGKPGDIPAIQKLHNTHEGNIACSILRSAAHLASNWEQWKRVHVLTNRHGNILAYYLPNPRNDLLQIDEIGLLEPAASPPLLHACATAALDAQHARIRFVVPEAHPFTAYLQETNLHCERHQDDDGNGMMAFVNVGEALESMLPEWELRLQESPARDSRTHVTFIIEQQPYRIRANHGALDIAVALGTNKLTLTAPNLMHLLTGHQTLQSILDLQRRIITADGIALLDALFPKRSPFVWPADRF